MIEKFLIVGVVLIATTSARGTDVVSRAETTELRLAGGKKISRVERDSQGNVIGLRLDDMHLTHEEFVQIGRLEHLRSLVLFRTNASDRDVARLEQCQSLVQLNLTSTEITNESIDTILKLGMLRTLCLGNVNITPDAARRLKEAYSSHVRSSNKPLRLGYSQRAVENK